MRHTKFASLIVERDAQVLPRGNAEHKERKVHMRRDEKNINVERI